MPSAAYPTLTMPPHDSGERGNVPPSRILYGSHDPDRSVVSALESRYTVRTATTAEAVAERLDDRTDCLVVDAEVFRGTQPKHLGLSEGERMPVVVFADTVDPALMRSVARRPAFDLVYRDSVEADPTGSEPNSEVDRLSERIDAACRNVPADLDSSILELAGLLMGAAPDEVDTRIEWGLRSVGEALGATRCVLYDCGEASLGRTHEWAASEPLSHESVPTTAFPGFEASLERFDPFVATDAERIPEELGYEGGSFVAVPVVIEWDLTWVLAFGGVPSHSVSEPTLTRLGTFGDLIGHTLRRDRRLREIERQNERLERFASVIRHDLQTPLNVISGFANLARESGDVSDIERIDAAASRMETILEDLYALVHEANDLGDREPTAVSDLVDRARTTVDMGETTVDVDGVGVIEADPGRLQQALENIFQNAVEHAGPDASLRIVALEDGFAIEDDGPGIPEADHGRVFDQGYTDGGTGLGLSIVRTVIEAHGWDVSVTDAPDGGARFEITGVQFVNQGGHRTDAVS